MKFHPVRTQCEAETFGFRATPALSVEGLRVHWSVQRASRATAPSTIMEAIVPNLAAPFISIAAIGAGAAEVSQRHIDHMFRAVLRGPNVVADPRFLRLMTGEAHPFGNFAIVSDPFDEAGAAAAIEPLLDCGAPAAALFLGQPGPAVIDRLRAAGFEAHEPMPAMAVEIDSLAQTSLPSELAWTRVGSGAEGDEWASAFAEGYELPRGVAEAFSPNQIQATKAADAPIQYFAVRKAGRIVCTSILYLAHGVAGIYGVATIPEERKKGLGAHATAEPLRHARTLGYRVGVLQSSEAGHPVYRRLGFKNVGIVPMFLKIPNTN